MTRMGRRRAPPSPLLWHLVNQQLGDLSQLCRSERSEESVHSDSSPACGGLRMTRMGRRQAPPSPLLWHLVNQQLGDLLVRELENFLADVLRVLARSLTEVQAGRILLATVAGAGSPFSCPERLQVTSVVDERDDVDGFFGGPIDETIAPDKKFADTRIAKLGHHTAPLRQVD